MNKEHMPIVQQKPDNQRKDLGTMILKNKYQLCFFSKGGGFGEVYIAKHITKEYDVAVKFVTFKLNQYNIKVTYGLIVSIGFPRLLTHGLLEEHQLSYMVITKFDCDLELMFTYYKRKFPLQTILLVGMQMLDLLEKFHSLGFVHNDMKPQNIMTKYGQNQVYLIDFGLTSNTAEQKKYKFRGTPFFASNSALLKQGNGPKDDIESLIYILIYFNYGNLPWTKDIPVLQDDVMSNLQIQNVIHLRSPYNLCQDIDSEFAQMLDYLQNISYKKKPNYKLIRSLFESMMQRYKYKHQLDWSKLQGPPVDLLNQEGAQLTKNLNSKCVKSKIQSHRHAESDSSQRNNNMNPQNSRKNNFNNNLDDSFQDQEDNISEEVDSINSKSKYPVYQRECKESRSFQLLMQPSEFIRIRAQSFSDDENLDEQSMVNNVYLNRIKPNNIKLQSRRRNSSMEMKVKQNLV
ncbi:protein kinase-like protein [Stylonychia lemnae]|uniref:Casein kinase I n=1 Tax=Stylonychia lemnae TaxID=5949 RepID=A0A078AIX0_STYLE|nr:protein kinase-like protein [Stylonychia lemnae]|eukprot:CDW82169.1 protein kinase-like protein [Stylonychia lemnae]